LVCKLLAASEIELYSSDRSLIEVPVHHRKVRDKGAPPAVRLIFCLKVFAIKAGWRFPVADFIGNLITDG
jgi:hypothetical protein